MNEEKLIVYPVPEGISLRKDYTVFARCQGNGEWKEIACYEVNVDMHDVRKASMAFFDFSGKVDVRICFNIQSYMEIYQVDIRPKSRGIVPEVVGNEIRFSLERPEMLSIEVNRDRFRNLHLFAGKIPEEVSAGERTQSEVLVLKGNLSCPAGHNAEELKKTLEQMPGGRTLVFEQGIHYFSECIMKIPSDTNIYIPGGAVIIGGFVCDGVSNVRIYGRGVIYQARFERLNALRGVRISHSNGIRIEGVAFVNPPHYTVYVGGSENIVISGIKSFSCEGWSDGIDIMSSRNIQIKEVFMRNSDDCIAIYGHRWNYFGDTCNILVEQSILWADVAHPMNIGCHGDHKNGGNLIQDIVFRDVDVLEHHEPQKECMGCMCINAGDGNVVRNISFENIRVEHMEHGKLLDIRTICGRYNLSQGKLVDTVLFKNISFWGHGEETSEIGGLAGSEVRNIIFENLNVRGQKIENAKQGNIHVGENVGNVVFV